MSIVLSQSVDSIGHLLRIPQAQDFSNFNKKVYFDKKMLGHKTHEKLTIVLVWNNLTKNGLNEISASFDDFLLGLQCKLQLRVHFLQCQGKLNLFV